MGPSVSAATPRAVLESEQGEDAGCRDLGHVVARDGELVAGTEFEAIRLTSTRSMLEAGDGFAERLRGQVGRLEGCGGEAEGAS